VPSIDVELRLVLRYAVSANVVFSWEERGACTKGEGVTRDRAPMDFLFTQKFYPEGVLIRAEVVFPPLYETRHAAANQCSGTGCARRKGAAGSFP